MLIAAFLLGATSIALDFLSLLAAFLLLLGPRGSNKDLIPAGVIYGVAVLCGLIGFALAWVASRRSATPNGPAKAAMLINGAGLGFGPACVLFGWMLCRNADAMTHPPKAAPSAPKSDYHPGHGNPADPRPALRQSA